VATLNSELEPKNFVGLPYVYYALCTNDMSATYMTSLGLNKHLCFI